MNNPIVQPSWREAFVNNYGGVPSSGHPSRPATKATKETINSTSSKAKDGLGEDEKNDTLSSGTTHNLSATDACVHNSTRLLAGGEVLRNADGEYETT